MHKAGGGNSQHKFISRKSAWNFPMFFEENPCTIIVGKCWTTPHDYQKKEKMKT